MRDSGYDFLSYDPFSTSKYADYFEISHLPIGGVAAITAFEVFEHLPNPAIELSLILGARPDAVIFTTQFYNGNGVDWDYLVPSCGQHVFFYSEDGLRAFATSRGYYLSTSGAFSVLVRHGGNLAGLPTEFPLLDPAEVGALVMEFWNGSAATMADGLLARNRFDAELACGNRYPEPRPVDP